VVAEDFGRDGGGKGVVDTDGDVGRGSGNQVIGLLVPQNGAERGAPSNGTVGLP